MSTTRYAIYGGTMAALASAVTLMLAAKGEGKGALRPINATSHWLNGDAAGAFARADMRHTGIGLLTHAASALFWAFFLALRFSRRPPRGPLRLFGEASLLSAFAALFDYTIVPRRLTPGWELAVSKRSIAGAFAAMALGLAVGAWAAQRGN